MTDRKRTVRISTVTNYCRPWSSFGVQGCGSTGSKSVGWERTTTRQRAEPRDVPPALDLISNDETRESDA